MVGYLALLLGGCAGSQVKAEESADLSWLNKYHVMCTKVGEGGKRPVGGYTVDQPDFPPDDGTYSWCEIRKYGSSPDEACHQVDQKYYNIR